MTKVSKETDIQQARIAQPQPVICIIDPGTDRAFGLSCSLLDAARKNHEHVVYAPSGARVDIESLFSMIGEKQPNGEVDLASAMQLSMQQPGYDADLPVIALIQDDDARVNVRVDIGGWLTSLASGNTEDHRLLSSLAQQIVTGDCGCNSDTDCLINWTAISNSHDMQKFFDSINVRGCGYTVMIDCHDAVAWLRKHLPAVLLDAATETEEVIEFVTSDGRVLALAPEDATRQAVMKEAITLLEGAIPDDLFDHLKETVKEQIDLVGSGPTRCVRLVPHRVAKSDIENVINAREVPTEGLLAQKLVAKYAKATGVSDDTRIHVLGTVEMLCALVCEPA